MLWIDEWMYNRWVRFRLLVWGWDFSLLHSVKIGSGIHPVFYSMSTDVLIPRIKRPNRESYRLCSDDSTNEGVVPHPYIFMAWVINKPKGVSKLLVLVLVLARLVLVGRLVWLLLVLVNPRPHYFSCSPGFGAWGSVYLLVVRIGCSTSTSNVDAP
jgi:hypothetical protein